MNQEDRELERQNMRERSIKQKEERQRVRGEEENNKKEMRGKLQKGISKRTSKSLLQKYQKVIGYASVGLLALFVLYSYLTVDRRKLKDIQVNEADHIRAHNRANYMYRVEEPGFFEDMTLASANELFRNGLTNKKTQPKCNTSNFGKIAVPQSFNFYKQNPKCKFEDIQPKCSASYAAAHASVYRNRLCRFGVSDEFTPSLDYLLNCDTSNQGCKSGFILQSLEFVSKNGHIEETCWKTLERKEGKCPSESELSKCPRSKQNVYCVLEGIADIKREMYKNGPVVSMIQPRRNFLILGPGLYDTQDSSRKLDGLQAVKIIGWDRDEKGREYWLIENLWGKDWAEEGIAKILMGSEDSLLDKFAVALYPAMPEVAKPA